MNDIITTNSKSVTDLVTAGETLFETISGDKLSANAAKVSSGITGVLDGLFPAVAAKVKFDLDGVFEGATGALSGINKAIASAKVAPATASSALGGA